jgi:hypothetical protein
VLAGLERSHGLIGMLVVPRRDDDELKLRVAEDRVEVAEDLDPVVLGEVAPCVPVRLTTPRRK